MLPLERRNWIEVQIIKYGKVDIEELAKRLDVSTMTIRRDLAELEKLGKVIRTHGGAISPESLIRELPYSFKEGKNLEQKKAIAQRAVSLIPKNSRIILDSGTTTLELAKLLKFRSDLTVVTNDIKIAAELIESDLHVIVTGGELQNNVGALYGGPTIHFLENTHVEIFFLGANAVDLQFGVSTPTLEKSLIKQLMMNAAETTWLLADSSKFGKKAFSSICPISKLEGIITDVGLSEDERKRYEREVILHIEGSGGK